MTSKINQSAGYAALEIFPDFPPRDDLQNSLHLDDDAHQAILRQYLGNEETTIVLGEVPVRWTPSQRRGHRIPDLLVAFNIDRAQAIYQNGYSIQDLGKPPDLVLEVASWRTADNDVTNKRVDYANFGIPEYWRYDPTGGQRYDAPLAGDRLAGGSYQPMEIREIGPDRYHGYSEVLGLEVCWDHGQLRWYDRNTEQYLMNFRQEIEARLAAERQAESERYARLEAEARIRELEEKLRDQGESR